HNEGRTALVFDNGKVQILMHRATPQSDLRYFRAYVAQKNKNGAPGAAIGQVNGRPALVIPPKSAVVIFNRDGVSIGIYSNTYGTDTLLAIASSMQKGAPVPVTNGQRRCQVQPGGTCGRQ